MAVERLSQGGVQGVHRAVALGHFVPHFVADAELHRGFGRRVAVAVGFDVDVVVQQLEVRLKRAGRPLDQQVERRLGRLELVAAVLQLDDLLRARCSISSVSCCRLCFAVRAMMFDRPESSLTSTRRSLPTGSGSMCS